MQVGAVQLRPVQLLLAQIRRQLQQHFAVRLVTDPGFDRVCHEVLPECTAQCALRAAQMAIDEKLAHPILIGRPSVIAARIEKAGLRMRLGVDVENVNPEEDARFRQYWEHYHQLMKRNGATPAVAKAAVRRSNTIIGALMVPPAGAPTAGRLDAVQEAKSSMDAITRGTLDGASLYINIVAMLLALVALVPLFLAWRGRGPRGAAAYAFVGGAAVLWTVANERDELGDNLVPDYMTSVKDGAFYGWPYNKRPNANG